MVWKVGQGKGLAEASASANQNLKKRATLMLNYDKVRDHFKTMQFSSASICEDMCKLTHEDVCAAMRQLLKEKRIDPVPSVVGLYQFNSRVAGSESTKLQAPPEQQRMWWAMNMPHNAPHPFTAFSVAQLANAPLQYAYQYCLWLLKREHIRIAANSPKTQNRMRRIYRVCAGAPAADAAPAAKLKIKEIR